MKRPGPRIRAFCRRLGNEVYSPPSFDYLMDMGARGRRSPDAGLLTAIDICYVV